MIETRQITQIKVWKLIMNMMRGNIERGQLIAVSDNKDKLIQWYKDQLSEEVYEEPGVDEFSGGSTIWYKHFKMGSILEWFNPIDISEPNQYGHGFQYEWVDSEYYYSGNVPYIIIV